MVVSYDHIHHNRIIPYVALIPPTKVYTTTPTGSKKVAAMICIPVKAEIAAEAPRSILATANRLFTRHKNMNTKCAMVPAFSNKNVFH